MASEDNKLTDQELRILQGMCQSDMDYIGREIAVLKLRLQMFREIYGDRLNLGHRASVITFLLIALDTAEKSF